VSRRPSLDALKQERDRQPTYGPALPVRARVEVERDLVTGHTFRTVQGMGTIEYAPKDCKCPECEGRRR